MANDDIDDLIDDSTEVQLDPGTGHRWQRALVAGGEVHVATDLWFRLSAGVETPAEGGKTRFVSTFKINAAPATSDAAESKQK
jgi:hypothetical protein